MRRSLLFAAPIVAVLVIVAVGGVFVLDRRAKSRIADGVRVGGVDVGGLTPTQARGRLHARLIAPLDAPVVVRRGDRTWRLSAQQAKVRVDVDAMVAEAKARSTDGDALTLAVRELRGGRVDASLPARVRFSDRAVRALVARVERGVERPARDATVSFSGVGVTKVAGHDGRSIDAGRLEDRIGRALRHAKGSRRLSVATRATKPEVTMSDLAGKYPVALAVDRSHFKLRLFNDLKLEKTYPIAVGQIGLETPAGLYHITNKAIDPAWTVPNSAWAGDLAGKVIPGGAPDNPLKARWLGVYDGVGVHGTSDDGSIGSAASHGCIRMHIPDVEDLYPRVPVQTPIYIG